jgi:hypothetical protein
LRVGFGTLTKLNGGYYQGEWFEGKKQGRGECKDEFGKFYSGLFHDDQMMGFGFENFIHRNNEEVQTIQRTLKVRGLN